MNEKGGGRKENQFKNKNVPGALSGDMTNDPNRVTWKLLRKNPAIGPHAKPNTAYELMFVVIEARRLGSTRSDK